MPRRLPDLKHNVATLPPIESKYISRVPFTLGLIGQTASGKTHLGLSIVKLLLREGTITRLFVCCPTLESNVIYNAVIDRGRDILFTDPDKVFEALREVQADCERAAEAYAEDLRYVAAHRRYTAGEPISGAEEHMLESRGWRSIEAKRPSPLLILDDLSHTRLYSTSRSNPLTNLVLRSRHLGDGLGISIMLLCQTYTSGVPRALRQNTSHWAFFHTESERELKAIGEELGGVVAYPEFCRRFRWYTAEKHGYMWVDVIRREIMSSF